jgi:hypothetical protein
MSQREPDSNTYTASALEIRRLGGLKAGGEPFSSFCVAGIPYPEVVNPILASYYMPLALTGPRLYRSFYFAFLRARMAWRRYCTPSVPPAGRPRPALRTPGGKRRVLFLNFWENHYTQLFSSFETLPGYSKDFATVLTGLRSRGGAVPQLGVYDYFPGKAPEYKSAVAAGARLLDGYAAAALAEAGLTDGEKKIRATYFRLLGRSLFFEFPAFSDFWRSAEALLTEVKPALVCSADFCDTRCRAFFLLARRMGIPTLVMQQGLVSDAQSEFFFPVSDRVALWDEDSLRLLARMGLPDRDFQVTGNPGYDKYFTPPSLLAGTRRMILFVSQPHHRHGMTRAKMDRMKRAVLGALSRLDGFEIVIKPHPDEPVSYFESLIAEQGWTGIKLLQPGADTGAYIAKAFALVGFYSTALIEGILSGKPVVVFDDEGDFDRFTSYRKDGAAYPAATPEEVIGFFKAYDGDAALRESLKNGRAAFVSRRVGRFDGKATERVFEIMAGLAGRPAVPEGELR